MKETTGYQKIQATPQKAVTLAVDIIGCPSSSYTTFRSIDSRSQVEMKEWRVS